MLQPRGLDARHGTEGAPCLRLRGRIPKLLEERDRVEKRYLAIAWGAPERGDFRVELPLELDPTAKYKVKMRVAKPRCGKSASAAR